MFTTIYNALLEWNRETDDRSKLQHIYLMIAIVSVVIAGVVSLIDPSTGRDLLVVPVIAGVIYLVNAVLWALVESTILSKLTGRHKK